MSGKKQSGGTATWRIGLMGVLIAFVSMVTGCASVPLASTETDAARKRFDPPTEEKAGVYVYRTSSIGQALKKTVCVDEIPLGRTAPNTYFYIEVDPGKHTVSTESEFGYNSLDFIADAGVNYFFEQYLKMGIFVGGANVKAVSQEKGKAEVLKCKLAQGFSK